MTKDVVFFSLVQGRPNGPTLGWAEGRPLVLSGGPGRPSWKSWVGGPARADLKSFTDRTGTTSILNLPTSILNMFSMHKRAKKISRGRADPG